ncbi:hypothetical protein [Shewanella sp. YLB-07]|uniref:hypothetical protein n=1 Tax=Shewanella sp. YLB-07 TaxID=2601268 RepID=UPI00128B0FCD|nr:hypothetical protein [Shewanella sp. YLB-07]MPY24373.1 hypothetical protein [Shewanella sp. YLB-07]
MPLTSPYLDKDKDKDKDKSKDLKPLAQHTSADLEPSGAECCLPKSSGATGDVIQVEEVDKIGIEIEIPSALFSGRKAKRLTGDEVLAKSSQGYYVGSKCIPNIELQVEAPQGGMTAQGGGFVEIVFGPLSKGEVLSHSFKQAVSELKGLLLQNPISINDLITQYNSLIGHASIYRMAVVDEYKDVIISPGKSDAMAMQTNIMLDFRAIGESAKVADLFDGARKKNDKVRFIKAQTLAKKWQEEHGDTPNNLNIRSFLTLLIFQTDYCMNSGSTMYDDEDKTNSFPVFFRTSPEDIIFSILSNAEVEELERIGAKINQPGRRGTPSIAKKAFVELNTSGDKGVAITTPFKAVFTDIIPLRKDYSENRRLNMVVEDDDWPQYAPDGMDAARAFPLTMFWEDCRRDVMQKGHNHYIVAEIREQRMNASLNWKEYDQWKGKLAKEGTIGSLLPYTPSATKAPARTSLPVKKGLPTKSMKRR